MPKGFHLCDEEFMTIATPSTAHTPSIPHRELSLAHPRTPPPAPTGLPNGFKTPARPVRTSHEGLPSTPVKPLPALDIGRQHRERGDQLKPTPISPSRGNGWDERKLDVGALLKSLYCEDEQKSRLRTVYDAKEHFAGVYTDVNQARAQELLKCHGLDLESLQSLDSKWSVAKTSGRRRRKLTADTRMRKIYQCACGYHTDARQRRRAKVEVNGEHDTGPGGTTSQHTGTCQAAANTGSIAAGIEEEDDENAWKRRAPYPFTGCLAHADVTYIEETGFVLRILGYFEHNVACQEATMIRFPAIPLHPHVIDVAQGQLRENASVSQIRNMNLQMLAAKMYREQHHTEHAMANHRYNLQTSDFRGLYRRHYRDHFGIDINVASEHNIHNWLNPESRYFKKEIHAAIFKYEARTKREERLKVCISTKEMCRAAWRYVHRGQLVLDGTFGLCDSRVLVWIAMGIDERGSGIPVAIFLFSAPTGNKATHAGYDTAIITELLRDWRDWLSLPTNAPAQKTPDLKSDSPVFTPTAAMTDTDTKERGALLMVWPAILLLLCRFHVRQCWTNKRGTLLKPLDGSWRPRVEAHLRALEEALLETVVHEEAVRLVLREETGLVDGVSQNPEAQKAATAVQSFTAYLQGTWMPLDMWRSWSKKGRTDAAVAMGVPVETIIRTSNHLESFNGKLKGSHIPQWQHSGRRLRFDVLTYHLVADIIPRIFARHRVANAYSEWKVERFRSAAGGADLRTVATGASSRDVVACTPDLAFVPRTWYEPDTRRDQAARTLYAENHLSPIPTGCPYELWATCLSAKDAKTNYSLTVHPSGAATCTCPDWLRRGGACKHLRAFRFLIEDWSQHGRLSHAFLFPLTEAEAAATDQRNRQWYGDAYGSAVTSSSSSYTSETSSFTVGHSLLVPPAASTHHSSLACVLPPPHLDDTLPTSLNLALELESLESDDHAALPTPSIAGIAEFPTGDAALSATSVLGNTATLSSNQRAVHLQVQSHLEAEVSFFLPRLHGLNSTLRGSHHVLDPSSNLIEFRAALDEFRNLYDAHLPQDVAGGPSAVSAASTSGAYHHVQTAGPSMHSAALKRPLSPILPPSPEPKQKRKKSYKTA